MPTKVLLSQLRTSFTFTMNPLSSRATLPIFSPILFSFNLKHLPLQNAPFHLRPLSTHSSSGSRGKVRASKSLIDEESELSGWVSELRTDSYRGRLTSDDDDNRDSVRGRGSGMGRGRGGGRGGGRGRGGSGGGGGGRIDESTRRGTRDSFDSGNRGRGTRDSFDSGNRGRGSVSGRGRGRGRDMRGESTRRETRDPLDSFSRRNSRAIQNFNGEKDEFRSSRNNNNNSDNREAVFGKSSRRGVELRNATRMSSQSKSEEEDEDEDDDEDEVVDRFNSRGFDEFLSDDDDESEGSEEDDEILSKSKTALFGNEKTTPRAASSGGSESYLSDTRFDQCSVSPLSLKAVKDAGYEKMTVVQAATLPIILQGKDVLAKARTGTGKTVAFLLPSIEAVAKLPPSDRDQRRPPIHVLVICPTRELASQAATEATKLLKYHPTIGVQVVIGGTRLALEQKRMQANPCQILVATPGRLRDHVENTAGFATRLMGVKVLVLDEADHLLDMGFRKDIEKIIAATPKQRQTLMFSATVPEEVRQVCHIALRRDHEYINTVEEGSEETHSKVHQTHLVATLDKHFSFLYTLLKEHIADDVEYKVLVFCTTAMVTRLVAELLAELKLNVREIHSRKPQSYRTRVSEEFRKSKGIILVTSDVSARGVDYPDVTLVIQLGIPADREQYIHRLGRTGRKGKEGQGILLLAPWEEFFLSTAKDLPIEKAAVPSVDPETTKKVEKALAHVEMKNKEAAYQAWLGYYNSNKKIGKDKYRLVELANEFSRSMGLDNPPAIPKLVLGKMGLRNIPGLRTK
ncbi:PREDICTED: DEAD-box ATP-dependent RNA helicase 31-like isoform X2 [Lupinus angustifolius]|uniref:DEAD-box ATP-dependent RNA helicase 31-like isoform X1 n=1 Tax=Lupinus angustifolius TaxID=3871 RepID=UPI00092EA867|nr:PREDICTED: DEAD-box ATP-dependent RNA helicase 31-like isoform X1 [Lupinus angustifolius]XP_019460873.1 PREDICTED: DEAD-box ATP-dependent RNA helicase 31-like isoform X2 [Lupinus angustifolius]